ncbi:Probable thiol oxidoreductase with 2 cytochrome c heme-binding sites [hydrothermal vent metagenome]|uniref:Probable thiol oxidoreductase with 2 cytochrome c heme-binding sites n=1 Tax=hydrothermal vent metagenome TaxID=652676 RepID=A0A3B0TIS7_9ZZZZ
MDFESLSLFALGRSVFRRDFTPAGQGSTSFDGLGPLMNAPSCAGCHVNDGRGAPSSPGDGAYGLVSMILKLERAPGSVYGDQLQDFAIEGMAPEGRIRIDYGAAAFTYPDGTKVALRVPKFSVEDPGYGPLGPDMALAPRIAPSMIGLGLLAAIPEGDLAAGADPDDADGDGVSGRLAMVRSARGGEPVPGRFGWKATQATLEDQIAAALALDMGLSSPLVPRPAGDCTTGQTACLKQSTGESADLEGLEVHSAPFAWLVRYSEAIAVPAPRPGAGDDTAAALFVQVGCAACHTPSHVLPPNPQRRFLGGSTIWPYTDLLLHDLGPQLADPVASRGGDAGVGRGEWRTPPLWAVGLSGAINGNTGLLHDGRARTIEEAILWHGGEAAASRDRFAALSAQDRQRLIAFVAAL